jgi:hypothetical protein
LTDDQVFAHHLATEYDCLPSVTFLLKDRNVPGWYAAATQTKSLYGRASELTLVCVPAAAGSSRAT